jgi:hypothetical protein
MSTDNTTLNQDQAPDVQMSPGQPMPQLPDATQAPQPTLAPQPGGSRLAAILGAVARVATTGLSGIPSQGRPSFVTGLGQGARAEQAAQAAQQEIKFRNFDDQVRAAQLHAQDLHLQNATQEAQDAHEDHMQKMHANDEDWGIKYDTIANNGDAVMDHLRTQTAASGAVSVPPGTHISGDGDSILIPRDTPETQAGQLQQFKTIAPALGMNVSVPQGATKLDPKVATVFYNKLQGFDPNGMPYTADVLPSLIASNQSRLDDLKKQGAPQVQINALSGIVAKQKAHLQADRDAANGAADAASKRKIAEQNAINDNKAGNTEDINSKKPQKAVDNTELNAVAYDPNYPNPDGSKGANVVMSKSDAAAKGLTHYKADPAKLNSLVAGFNDVQNKLNMLADIANDPKRMGQVDPGNAAAIIAHDKGIDLGGGAFGAHASIDTSRINEKVYAAAVNAANQATKDYVTAFIGAHEAITQLPRLQTFGQSSRMTEQQMHAAVNLLPHPGDGAMAQQKMTSLQQMLDPLRKQVPHMPGAEQMPSWLEKQQQQKRQAAPSAPFGSNLANYVGGLQPK